MPDQLAIDRFDMKGSVMIKQLSAIEICQKFAVICQKTADQTPQGDEHDRSQNASERFKVEAKSLRYTGQ